MTRHVPKVIVAESIAYFPGKDPYPVAARNGGDATGILLDRDNLAADGAVMTVRVRGCEYDVDEWVAYTRRERPSVEPIT